MKSIALRVVRVAAFGLALTLASVSTAQASPFYWTDWVSCNPCGQSLGSPFVGNGTITTPTTTLNVTYSNNNGVGFFQTGGLDTDYYSTVGAGGSPYTSTTVDNRPPAAEMIALQFQGGQTLTFSQTVANPVFAFVSLNANGYAFVNQDFEILSDAGFNYDGQGVDACGYWGCGGITKVVLPQGNGDIWYLLNATNENGTEPHGVIRFTGAFNTLAWTSSSNEYWNGFTVGVQGTAREVFDPPTGVPEPGTIVLLGSGLALAVVRARRKR
jgi:hypothetical protein